MVKLTIRFRAFINKIHNLAQPLLLPGEHKIPDKRFQSRAVTVFRDRRTLGYAGSGIARTLTYLRFNFIKPLFYYPVNERLRFGRHKFRRQRVENAHTRNTRRDKAFAHSKGIMRITDKRQIKGIHSCRSSRMTSISSA